MRKIWLPIAVGLLAAGLIGCAADVGTKTTAAPTTAPVSLTQSSGNQSESPTETPMSVSTQALNEASTVVLTVIPTATVALEETPAKQQMTGLVVEVVERNSAEIELLQVWDDSGRLWEFVTEGPIGIDTAHLLTHFALGQGVEVVYLEKDGRLIALEVNDLVSR